MKYKTRTGRVGAIGPLWISEFYAEEHDRMPGSMRTNRLRKKGAAVVVRWWNHLPAARQQRYEDIAQGRLARIREHAYPGPQREFFETPTAPAFWPGRG